MKFFKNLLRNEAGATAIEYGLIAALIAVAAITAMQSLGNQLSTTFNKVATDMQGRPNAPPNGKNANGAAGQPAALFRLALLLLRPGAAAAALATLADGEEAILAQSPQLLGALAG